MVEKQEENQKDWDSFLNLFLNIDSKPKLEMLFQLFMTMNEREMLLKRYRIVKALLTTELSQREIAEQLHLSISKITAGSKATQILPEADVRFLAKKMK